MIAAFVIVEFENYYFNVMASIVWLHLLQIIQSKMEPKSSIVT